MLRAGVIVVSLMSLALLGCRVGGDDTGGGPVATEAAAPADQSGRPSGGKPSNAEREQQLMAYSHSMWLISQPETVLAHFQRARDRCLNDAALNCILLAGDANAGDESARMPPSADLTIALPRAQVPAFKRSLLAALPGKAADITVRSEKIEADNVTKQVMDIDQHIKQLTGYRDRLTELVRQPEIKTTELIELEAKIAEIQGQLDALATERTGIMDRVRRDRVSLRFTSESSVSDAGRPLAEAWEFSFEILGRSASALLTLIVVVLPWVPVIGLIWLVAWLFGQRGRKRREREAAAKATAQARAAANGNA